MTVVAYADGVDSPRSSPAEVAAAAGLAGDDVEVVLGWTLEDRPWLARPGLRGRALIAGYALSRPVAEGRLRYVPLRLSSIPRFLAELRPDVAVVTAVRRGDGYAFGASVGWGHALARAAAAVVVEVDEEGADLGGPPVPGTVVAEVPRPPGAASLPGVRPPDEVELALGRTVVSLLPDDPTIQVGMGGTVEAMIAGIDRPVRVRSGLVTDAVASLHDRGLLEGAATAAYTWGGAAMARLAAAGRLRLVPLEETHDLTRLSSIDRFVALNTALQVGLDGSVNIERVGGRFVVGLGGHPDFAVGAARSVGGRSIVALRSTTKDGGSTIVPCPEVVSTPRCDVDLVVTEHGVADLRGVDDAERARRLVAVAAPEHREVLESARASR